ncbi:hydroxyacylglutathione hydrolase [Thermosynechococcus sp. TA-1]|uniref:hydroxyacylglutathione hydrolase n=1 Tax=Thermosynechococcus sp. TA-1 TaxID=2813673 RepID=UPI0019816A3D|nr:hydroxyacylglutathione hydrolase [Thermosynechococcus sp. TA-1]QSF48650.1 hydroxyacylglutathione hydrolase [Thermosynechococcus sp. TA-1]
MMIYRLNALTDNYIFLLHDPQTATAAVVDPAEPEPVLAKLAELGATLTAIFNTHHHWDHVGANRALRSRFPNIEVYGSREDQGRIPEQTVFLSAGDRVPFGEHAFEVLFVPGHTRGHIAYYGPVTGDLFCGDTLFGGGCGRLFEGTPAQMLESLNQLRQLPEQTRVWCAHEYTQKNLSFALTVDANNPALQERYAQVCRDRAQGKSTIPSTIGVEKATNPFLRCEVSTIQAAVGATTPLQTFTRLRGKRDQY